MLKGVVEGVTEGIKHGGKVYGTCRNVQLPQTSSCNQKYLILLVLFFIL